MLISNKAFFFHIPKTAGTSIESVFGGCPNPHQTKNKKSQFAINYQHAFPSEINTRLPSFCFARNPWDRVVSYFFHLKKYRIMDRDVLFIDFLRALNNNFEVWIYFRKSYERYEHHRRSAYKMILPSYKWVQEGTLIGKFENLQEDFNAICDKIGIERKTLPHIGKTKHKHYAEYYNDETREIVGKKYAKDIEYFGYEFGS
ncbi:MAG: hypothetical protein CL885_04180 [Dehalococcoidia bacterium]|nr:hypothetical protein [Dehalococcoidia bacterium]